MNTLIKAGETNALLSLAVALKSLESVWEYCGSDAPDTPAEGRSGSGLSSFATDCGSCSATQMHGDRL